MIQKGTVNSTNNLVINEVTNFIQNIIKLNIIDIKLEVINSFSNLETPSITVAAYIERLLKYFKIEGSTLTISLIYLIRICKAGDFKLSKNSFHSSFLISLALATKYNEDVHFRNNYYAQIGGVSLETFNSLEREYLNIINYKLYIKKEEYTQYSSYLSNLIKSREN